MLFERLFWKAAESKLKHYNYFRDYDPGIGRYVQSDPMGLMAGLNTFAYVDGQPLMKRDPSGLAPPPICPNPRECVDPPFDPTPDGPKPGPQPKPKPDPSKGRDYFKSLCDPYDGARGFVCRTCVPPICNGLARPICCKLVFDRCMLAADYDIAKQQECSTNQLLCNGRAK